MASNRLLQRQNLANEGQLKMRKPQRMNQQRTCWLLASPGGAMFDALGSRP